MKSTRVLLIAILALGAVLTWVSLRSSERATPMSPEIGASSPKPSADDTGSTAVLEIPPAPVPQTETPAAQVDGERSTAVVEKVDFNAKYNGWSLERLQVVRQEVATRLALTVSAVLDERMKQGKFEESLVKDGEPAPALNGFDKLTGEGVGGGMMRYRIVKLPLEEYPMVNSLREEASWLQTRTQDLSSPPKH